MKKDIKKRNCEICGVMSETTAIIRTFYVCKDCFKRMRADNFIKHHLDEDITTSIITHEDMDYSENLRMKAKRGNNEN